MKKGLFILMFLMGVVSVSAYDVAVQNADGVTICYNYINEGTELEVTKNGYSSSYSGVVNIPESVTYMNRTRNVTSIGNYAFSGCHNLTSVTIPNSVTNIKGSSFESCSGLISVVIGNSVLSIGNNAFYGCGLTSIIIPNSVTSIGDNAFYGCSGLTSVTIPNSVKDIGASAFSGCYNLTSVNLPNSITSIGYMTFNRCYALTSVIIPNSVKIIGEKAFKECSSLTSVTIGNSVTIIGNGAFQGCLQLSSVNIPQSVTSIGEYAFADIDMPTVVSLIKDPFPISGSVFSINTFNNATLYVPTGTVDKYKEINGWNSFLFMEEVSGDSNPTTNKCEKPTIRYSNGKLLFESATEGALCQSTITDSDITSYSGNEVQLGVTYNISVYATATGYEDSDVATATLCWIDVEPKTEGIENSVSQVRAKAILIQTNNGTLSVTGVENGTDIAVYSSSGIMVGATNASGDSTSIATGLLNGEIAIVKIGDRAIKVVMK